MTMQHTPRPWKVDYRNNNCAYLEGPPRSYEECYFQNAADAYLIAAAPDLLEALKLCIDKIRRETRWDMEGLELQTASAAIAKATGGA